jgi:hypothetical protein
MSGNVLVVVSDADQARTLVVRALAEAPDRVGQVTLLSWSGMAPAVVCGALGGLVAGYTTERMRLEARRELRLAANGVPFDWQVELVYGAGFVRGAVRRQLTCSAYAAVIATSKVAAALERGRCGRTLRRGHIPLIAVG